jgi:hypothetical protein
MSGTVPTPRQVGNALAVLLALPPAVLQVLAERIVDRLDALDGDPDAEPDDDPEADHDGEAAPWAPDEHHWPPVKGPAECCAVRLLG